jgi:transaldolase
MHPVVRSDFPPPMVGIHMKNEYIIGNKFHENLVKITLQHQEDIKRFILKDLNEAIFLARPDPFWQRLKDTGTEIWLDTGDMDQAARIWTGEITALTTNNTLLNNEIQKGIYDDFISRAKGIVNKLPLKQQVHEIGFMLNARHGLRLAKKFNCMVSVELHTDFAHDYRATVEYGLRLFSLCPEHFLIKVPYTATGLIAARYLKERNVRINFTLEFSTRQNAFAALVVKPDYVNVFLGRLGAYVQDNELGSSDGIGERTTLATQRLIKKLTEGSENRTKLIAASIREAGQLENLAGVDTMTIPAKVAADGRTSLKGVFYRALDREFEIEVKSTEILSNLEKLWTITDSELLFASQLGQDPPKSGIELIRMAQEAGCIDMFPILSTDELKKIADEGKIPRHAQWSNRIRKGELAVDTLLNLAGLASFAKDQASLDMRIERILQD